MKWGLLLAHIALVLLIGALFGESIMLAFVAGEVFTISATETLEGRSPFKWLLWRDHE